MPPLLTAWWDGWPGYGMHSGHIQGVTPLSVGAGHLCLEQMVTLGHGLTPCAREALRAQAQAPSTSHQARGSLCQSTEQPQPLPAMQPLEEGAKKELQKQRAIKGRNQTPSLEEVLKELFWF